VKNVFPPLRLPTFLLDWVDVNANYCVYTAMQVAKFLHVHLVAGGWYLDCSCRFVPKVEESLQNTLASSAPEVIELKKELEENPAPPSNEKDVAPMKGKSRGMKLLAHASSQVSTHSCTKAFVQRIASPATTVFGSPIATPSAPLANHVAAPSHSDAIIPSMLCKRKAVALDTSTTSSERSSTLSFCSKCELGRVH
jgi:hypothetical protein